MLLVSLQQGEVTAEVDLTHEGLSEKGGDWRWIQSLQVKNENYKLPLMQGW